MIKDFIGIYENALSSYVCDKLIDHFEYMEELNIPKSRQETDNVSIMHKADKNMFIDQIETTKERNMFCSYIEDVNIAVKTALDRYSTEFPSIDEEKWIINYWKLQKTKPTEGYHVWHKEHSKADSMRFLVLIVYLNDIEDGGETEFLYQQLRVPPKKGTLVLFPAQFTHIHRGNPPLKDTKYILTSWIEFD